MVPQDIQPDILMEMSPKKETQFINWLQDQFPRYSGSY